MTAKRKYVPSQIEMADKMTRWARGLMAMRDADVEWLTSSSMYRVSYRGISDYYDNLNDCCRYLLDAHRVWRGGNKLNQDVQE